MHLPLAQLPQIAPTRPDRPTQDNVPGTRQERLKFQQLIKAFVENHKLVPPMPLTELREKAEIFIEETGVDSKYLDYIAVTINNTSWRDQLATVPFNRRLLLLPKCLRDEEHCPAPFDEFGLLCKDCGMCSIQDFQAEAEKLGYAILTAEGSAIVMAIIETGKIDAIIGVSCLSVLEKAFPYMEAAAIPGIAIPLLQDDCKDTNVDIEDLWQLISLTSDDKAERLDLIALHDEVQSWFEIENLNKILFGDKKPKHLEKPGGETEKIARDWLAVEGKRWRPFLTSCVMHAMQLDANREAGKPLSHELSHETREALKKLAVAVECFHKASLVHDDIQDEDDQRYGIATVHAEHGIPMAINVGDLLIGEGYRLIGEVDLSHLVNGSAPIQLTKMLQAAAQGHRTLCLGQGTELAWGQNPAPLKSRQVLEIFRQKTAPAFEVALLLGGHLAGASDKTIEALSAFSQALGIAYQIKDDLDDIEGSIDSNDGEAVRPSVVLAVAGERAKEKRKADKSDEQAIADDTFMDKLWRHEIDPAEAEKQLHAVLERHSAFQRCEELLELYKQQAVRSLADIEHPTLKGLIRRVMSKIFGEMEMEGWCREHETSNAPGSETGARAAG